MSTTASSNQAQTPKTGQIFIGSSDFVPMASSTGTTFVDNGSGLFSIHVAASSSSTFFADLTTILTPPFFPNEQLYFQAGKQVDGTQPGIPGFPGAFIYSPLTGMQPAGLALQTAIAYYKIGTTNLTSASLEIVQSVYPADNTATNPTVTNILAATTLVLVQRANMYATTFTPSVQTMLVTPSTQVTMEIDVVTPASSTFDFYGVLLNVLYNY